MIDFFSASTRVVNSKRAIDECMENAFAGDDTDCDLVLIHASMGHNFQELVDQAQARAPSAKIFGASCCGIVGSEGVSESMKDVAVMAARSAPGEIVTASVEQIDGKSSRARGEELAKALKAQNPEIKFVYFLASGIDIANDEAIAGIESVLGESVTIFGATSADNMKGIVSYQMADQKVHEHAAFALGFADPSLEVLTRASHGFVVIGESMEVTRSDGYEIIELDYRPAWEVYTERLGLDSKTATFGETIPIGALAEHIADPKSRAEYGSDYLLRVVTSRSPEGSLFYSTTIKPGTKLWLTARNEELIFAEAQRMMDWFTEQAQGRTPLAVFHADCLARGRHSFGRIIKDELVHLMQHPFSDEGEIPPWIGMYGFGEFARLGGKNTYHNYTSALYAIYRTD